MITGDSGAANDFTYSGNITIQLTDSSIKFYYSSSSSLASSAIIVSLSSNTETTISLSYIAIVLGVIVGLMVLYGTVSCIRFYCQRGGTRVATSFQSPVWLEQAGARLERILKESPEVVYEPGVTQNKFAQATCTICLGEFAAHCSIRVLVCSHIFHKDCIESWIRAKINLIPKCPMCNVELTAERPAGFHPEEQLPQNNVALQEAPLTQARNVQIIQPPQAQLPQQSQSQSVINDSRPVMLLSGR